MSVETKQKLEKIVNDIGDKIFELRDALKMVENCDPSELSFMKYLATIVDNDVASHYMLGGSSDSTFSGFLDGCTVNRWSKGTFVSEWDSGEVIETPCRYDVNTCEVEAEDSDESPEGALECEYVITEDGEELDVCPHCHVYLVRHVDPPDCDNCPECGILSDLDT